MICIFLIAGQSASNPSIQYLIIYAAEYRVCNKHSYLLILNLLLATIYHGFAKVNFATESIYLLDNAFLSNDTMESVEALAARAKMAESFFLFRHSSSSCGHLWDKVQSPRSLYNGPLNRNENTNTNTAP